MAADFASFALEPAEHIRRLALPTGRVSMVLDTDTYNEVDDQFALVHALLSPDHMDVEAVHAAPFHNARSSGPADGMARSYDEILRVFDRLGMDPQGRVYRGSDRYLPAADQPVTSNAAEDLVRRGMADRDGPLYVLAIGAITNVASALLLEPRLVQRIVVVWLGGHPYDWPTADEFNLKQDMHASRLIFDSGVPLVHVPCKNVAEHLRTTVPELEASLRGRSRIGDFLCDTVAGYHDDHFAWAKVLWDVATTAWLVDPKWVPSVIVPAPVLTMERRWARDESRHLVRVATNVNRNAVFADLFHKMNALGKPTD
ncbi:MAG: nucleoside hydrolase [Phycisphaeraceae bacterium]